MPQTPATSLTLQQQAFCLSWLSNAASDKVDTLANLEAHVRQSVQAFTADNAGRVADWSIAWGPVASSHEGADPTALYYADNMLYAASASVNGAPCLVVAMAGTNEDDAYDWLAEDFSIVRQIDWPYGNGGFDGAATPKISHATATGVADLLAMKDPKAGGIQAFVGDWTKANPGGTVIFTGHSLGGALSPSLAMATVSQNGGPFADTTLLTLPSAGPTPGNPDFAALYTHFFPTPAPGSANAGPVPFNTDLVNVHDVVPTAWNDVKLTGFFTNTGDLAFKLAMDALLASLDGLAHGLIGFNTYQPIAHQTFAADPPDVDYNSLQGYFGLIVANHLAAYPTYVGVDDALTETTAAMSRATLRQVQTHAKRLTAAAQAQSPAQIPAPAQAS
ncbi:lipase family protein [Caulobacter endophyticus]|uniref:Fungal lipase-type domain-containing protein n=1 Tax=Caulobacter endophyticus TaxID=2172652 RepID=A0A2T9K4J7_9CAUL|nr:hypothetical protein [Caulobacter endophyticus]PVM90902.1 hypothetical protein DDF67_08035 [Caulobacter endophyticus]